MNFHIGTAPEKNWESNNRDYQSISITAVKVLETWKIVWVYPFSLCRKDTELKNIGMLVGEGRKNVDKEACSNPYPCVVHVLEKKLCGGGAHRIRAITLNKQTNKHKYYVWLFLEES